MNRLRILIVNTDYGRFLAELYRENPGLERRSYAEQMSVRMQSLFSLADFYSRACRELGHDAREVHPNNVPAQRAWCREQGFHDVPFEVARFRPFRGPFPWIHREKNRKWEFAVLREHVKRCRPDVLLNQAMDVYSPAKVAQLRPYVGCLVGQHAAMPLDGARDWSCYDLALSSFPPTVEFLARLGVASHYHKLCFEPSVLPHLSRTEEQYDISFVGSFERVHATRIPLLEHLCRKFPTTAIWAPDLTHVPPDSIIHRHYRGTVWGKGMYNVLYNSKITVNEHGDIAPFANNFRLYEATGVGTLLLTDWKPNLTDMFEPDREVVAYRTIEECAEKAAHYLEHEAERNAVAARGQQRTLSEHTVKHRVEEILALVENQPSS